MQLQSNWQLATEMSLTSGVCLFSYPFKDFFQLPLQLLLELQLQLKLL